MRSKKAQRKTAVIGFRLDPEHGEVLGERAMALGVSVHELARRYLVEMLEQAQERAALQEGLQTINGNLTHFRDDFIFAVEALLASAGKVKDTDASAWVDEHFK